MNKDNHLIIPCDPGKVSDGYHTFDELYEHRHALFLSLMNLMPAQSWFSTHHCNGKPSYEGWFIAGIHLPSGYDISYHLPFALIDQAKHTGAKELEMAPAWDGHTSQDVVNRLHKFIQNIDVKPQGTPPKRKVIVKCRYCGHVSKDASPEAMDQELKDHILTCSKHPLAEAEATITKLIEALRNALDTQDDNAAYSRHIYLTDLCKKNPASTMLANQLKAVTTLILTINRQYNKGLKTSKPS